MTPLPHVCCFVGWSSEADHFTTGSKAHHTDLTEEVRHSGVPVCRSEPRRNDPLMMAGAPENAKVDCVVNFPQLEIRQESAKSITLSRLAHITTASRKRAAYFHTTGLRSHNTSHLAPSPPTQNRHDPIKRDYSPDRNSFCWRHGKNEILIEATCY